jgi:peptidoglycan/xylan/chitin deacetylase (PgdA/CDA1 family)
MNSFDPPLWINNHPRLFWQCQPDVADDIWEAAIARSLPSLGLSETTHIDLALEMILGEARFGPNHWTLSAPKKIYYLLKPLLPRSFTRVLRQFYRHSERQDPNIEWPVEPRYTNFLWEVMAQILQASPNQELQIKSFWPRNLHYSLVLTHDVESDVGQGFVRAVADLEESLGFRSSFNFVPEGYRVNMNLVDELRQRGFEIGIHGLRHDGKLFNSRALFEQRAAKINHYLKDFGATGFRAPLTHRNPQWMQSLDIEYDLSFFDTDPFEPIPGGTMSIWPFFLGRFVELPYTLVQDYTLTAVLGETTPRLWLKKVDFIEKNCGMALLNSHPDYLKSQSTWNVYRQFLEAMKERECYWHALPGEIAGWWKKRHTSSAQHDATGVRFNRVLLDEGRVKIVK